MKKTKIAISIDESLLKSIDLRVDKSVIRSRSQAIEYFLKKGLEEHSIKDAVILLKGDHQVFSLKSFKGSTLIENQIIFFSKCGIKNVYIVTQHTKNINFLLEKISTSQINVQIIESDAIGNATALKAAFGKIDGSFIVMSGDTFNDFDILKMMKKHLQSEKLATMGLMTRDRPSGYGTAILDGDSIVDFEEKPKYYSTNIVNAGIYIFKPEVFELFNSQKNLSLERDIFPKLAKLKQLLGFFTYGEYSHLGA